MALLQFHQPLPCGQGVSRPCHRPFGCRRCLLKGCEGWFRPTHPQARYCGPACQTAARRWRCWHAGHRYRATDQGKQHRRDQSRRYRQRRAEPPAEPVDPGEGQRPAGNPENFPGRPCDRPGCYELFVPTARSPEQHFCCAACRQAFRRVRQREVRRRERRRRGVEPRRLSSRGPPRAQG